ncbi:MAG: pyridoxamine kinase [Clostridia bacterium]|nr:pyridoxamine kinase [Clostridia bacterium]
MDRQKRIALINDFCGFGRCSITVALPIISALKVQCCPVPTSVFSNHTGFDSFFKSDFTPQMDDYIAQWEKIGVEFDGILSGYLGSERQIDTVLGFVDRFKSPSTLLVVDPIMGDNGRLYSAYSPALARRMLTLALRADILTPNLTEACILTNSEYREDMSSGQLKEICKKLEADGVGRIVISGIDRGAELENIVYADGCYDSIRVKKEGGGRPGTGDIFSSIIAADAVKGVELVQSVQHAADFIGKVLRYTCKLDVPKPFGVCFEEFLTEI